MTKEKAIDYLDNYRKMYAELAPEMFLEALDVLLNECSNDVWETFDGVVLPSTNGSNAILSLGEKAMPYVREKVEVKIKKV